MNIRERILELIRPANTWLTVSWECIDEPAYWDGHRRVMPELITVTFKAHHKLGEPIDDSKYRFDQMVITGHFRDNSKVFSTHYIDKIEKVPLQFKCATDRNYDPNADI